MARKKALPLIEDFNTIPGEALVPEEEQPYPIPEHWKWVRLGFIASYLQRGKGPKYDSESSMLAISQKCVRWEGLDLTQARGWERTSFETLTDERILREGDILWNSTGTGTIGRLVSIPRGLMESAPKMAADSHVTVIRTTPVIQPQFLHYYLSSQQIQYRLEERLASGTTNQKELNLSTIQKLPIPLPPLDEQVRIVDQLAAHLAKVDEAIGRLEAFLEGSDTRTESLLEAAIQGHLTKDWRKQHNQRREEWKFTTLGEAFQWSSGGTPSRKHPEYYTGSIPWVKSGELPDGVVNEVEEHITQEAIENSSAKICPKGSVAIAMYGVTIGRVGILGVDAATNQAVAVAQSAEHTFGRYLFFYLRANRSRFIALGKGGAQPNISQRVIKAFPYEYPGLAEQEEILHLIDLNLEALSSAEALVEHACAELQESRRSLISAAVAGRLT